MSEDAATILVVDDDPLMCAALRESLGASGFIVVCAPDAPEGVREAMSRPVDMVLLDLHLPGLSGLDALRILREVETYKDLPVTVITASEDRHLRLGALELGIDDFLIKPVDPEELLVRIRRSVARKKRVDALVQEANALRQLSVTDGLTQIYNHRFFHERLKEEFRRAQRYDDPLALILIDVDHFKKINDRYGHPVGDEVLKDVARCLLRNVRETDLLARYGGEEFGVILPKTHLAGSLTVAERIWKDLGTLRCGAEGTIQVTASLGVAGYPGRGVVSGEMLLRAADDALYRSKREGRNKISLAQQVSFFGAQAS